MDYGILEKTNEIGVGRLDVDARNLCFLVALGSREAPTRQQARTSVDEAMACSPDGKTLHGGKMALVVKSDGCPPPFCGSSPKGKLA